MSETGMKQTEPVWRIMRQADEAARRAGRPRLTPPDVFRALLAASDGFHLRFLVDRLHLDPNALRELARQWELELGSDEDWALTILLSATGEATLAMRPYVNTEHVLLALLYMWPEAPCSAAIFRAAGGTIHQVRLLMSIQE
jgi:hypothetical protein